MIPFDVEMLGVDLAVSYMLQGTALKSSGTEQYERNALNRNQLRQVIPKLREIVKQFYKTGLIDVIYLWIVDPSIQFLISFAVHLFTFEFV